MQISKGAVIIYGGGAGANPKIARTQNLPPPLDNRALKICPPPRKPCTEISPPP